MRTVRADASDDRRAVENQVGFLLREIRPHVIAFPEVELTSARREDLPGRAAREGRQEGPSEEAAASRDEDPAAVPETHVGSVTGNVILDLQDFRGLEPVGNCAAPPLRGDAGDGPKVAFIRSSERFSCPL